MSWLIRRSFALIEPAAPAATAASALAPSGSAGSAVMVPDPTPIARTYGSAGVPEPLPSCWPKLPHGTAIMSTPILHERFHERLVVENPARRVTSGPGVG